MGVKERSYKIQIFLIQLAIYQVSSQLPQQITQYVLSSYGPNVIKNPALTLPTQSLPTQSLPTHHLPTQSLSPLPTQSLLPNDPSSCKSIPKLDQNGPLDSNVLNNIAIALQLLIVSNIMNMPDAERLSKLESISKLDFKQEKPILSYLPSVSSYGNKPIYYDMSSKSLYDVVSKPMYEMIPKSSYDIQPNSFHQSNSIVYDTLPNSKFLCATGFSEPSFSTNVGVRSNPRSSMTLMSPYDALGSSFGDSVTTYTKQDFQSPYASILAADGNKDLFSFGDLF